MKKNLLIALLALLCVPASAQKQRRDRPGNVKRPGSLQSIVELGVYQNINGVDYQSNKGNVLKLDPGLGAAAAIGIKGNKGGFVYQVTFGGMMNHSGFSVTQPLTKTKLMTSSFTNYYLNLKFMAGATVYRSRKGSSVELLAGFNLMGSLKNKRSVTVLYDDYTLTPGGTVYHTPIAYIDYRYGKTKNSDDFTPSVGTFLFTPTYQTAPLFGDSRLRIGLEFATKINSEETGYTNSALVALYQGKGDRSLISESKYEDMHLHIGLVLGLTF
ncbi:hypothetical protein DBR32_05090 [Taibaiella sp. KBW10]|uniref:hypothetical protein n=1 Tax=Taibaiella sp. KBW10 TaxID=2153357 RepID=UPI000F5A1E67|nr:hypothetical protein [Taibaiella sp. KBW10]RQO31341.1 hypothetical protein DBR32_05090 [Taibaiella sp. KBW10]